jgi:hypothetical protein
MSREFQNKVPISQKKNHSFFLQNLMFREKTFILVVARNPLRISIVKIHRYLMIKGVVGVVFIMH